MAKLKAQSAVVSSDLVRQHWPNNTPCLVTLEEMENGGWALECLAPETALIFREAWFVNIFGIHVMHLLRDTEIKRLLPNDAEFRNAARKASNSEGSVQ